MSKLYTHEETRNPVTLVQQSHSLDPAALDQCSVCPWKSSDETRPDGQTSGKRLSELSVMHATMAPFGLHTIYHHHVFMLLCAVDVSFFSSTSSNTDQHHREFYQLLLLLKNRIFWKRAILQYGVHKQRQLIPACGCRTRNWYSWAQQVVASTDACILHVQKIDHQLTFLKYKPVSS